jgi:hypothetical protein
MFFLPIGERKGSNTSTGTQCSRPEVQSARLHLELCRIIKTYPVEGYTPAIAGGVTGYARPCVVQVCPWIFKV